MTLEDRQRQAAYDFNRSSFTPTPRPEDSLAHILAEAGATITKTDRRRISVPPVISPAHKRLDAIAAADERDRQQRKAIEAMERDLIAHAKQREMKADDASR